MNNHNYRGGRSKEKDTFEVSPIQVKARPVKKIELVGGNPCYPSIAGVTQYG